jgi:hypothetical protein
MQILAKTNCVFNKNIYTHRLQANTHMHIQTSVKFEQCLLFEMNYENRRYESLFFLEQFVVESS